MERHRNLWAPWRMQYIDALSDAEGGCFLCRYRDAPADDERNLVLWRGRRTFAVLNRFPYTGGHLMVGDVQRVLAKTVRAQGFNIGINVGRCAGAGLPGHLHVHIVPRWEGDTNFMSVFGGARVIPQALETLYAQLRRAAEKMNLPNLTP